MDKQTELQQWIEIADKDFALAEYASKNMRPVPVEQICFHCQQTAEKYLKWFLVWHDIDPPKIHNLVELGKLCEKITPEFAGLYTQYVYLAHCTQWAALPLRKTLIPLLRTCEKTISL
jgi:HEPN domain-containing protein